MKIDVQFVNKLAPMDVDVWGETYAWQIYCSNCTHMNSLRVRKGVRVPKTVTCEKCGCSTEKLP